jgi:hypothetical protein
MSNIYNYDVFLSSAGEDRNSGRLLAQKLRELNFHVWLDLENAANDSSNSTTALEDSAVCLLLVGAGGNLSWVDDSHKSVIQQRLESRDRVLRIITVFLPNIYSHSNLIRPHPVVVPSGHGQSRSSYVHFQNTLDEKDSLDELILRIRGVDPRHQGLDGSFKSALQLRAQNTLNVDWYNLARNIHFSSLFTNRGNVQASLPRQVFPRKNAHSQHERELSSPQGFGAYRESLARLRLVQPTECKQIRRLPAGFKSIGSIAAVAAMVLVLIGVLAHLDRRYVEVGPKPNIVVEQPAPRSTRASDPVVDKSEKKRRSPGTPNVTIARTQSRSNSTDWPDRVGDFAEYVDHTSYSQTLEARRPLNSDTAPPGSKNEGSENLADVIDADIWSDPRKAVRKPKNYRSNHASRNLHLNSNEVARETTDSQRWNALNTTKLEAMRQIYVEFSNDTGLEKEIISRVIAEFTKSLRENGIEVSAKKSKVNDTAYGIARLRFGEREMKSGVVSVDIEDDKGQIIKSIFAPACTGAKTSAKTLCSASQMLGDKLSDALRDAEQQ